MVVPPNSFADPNASLNLVKRITQRLQQEKVDNQLLEILQQAVHEEMEQERILLSRPEKQRLFHQTAKAVLTDLLAKIDPDK